jgi:hypothetical protein
MYLVTISIGVRRDGDISPALEQQPVVLVGRRCSRHVQYHDPPHPRYWELIAKLQKTQSDRKLRISYLPNLHPVIPTRTIKGAIKPVTAICPSAHLPVSIPMLPPCPSCFSTLRNPYLAARLINHRQVRCRFAGPHDSPAPLPLTTFSTTPGLQIPIPARSSPFTCHLLHALDLMEPAWVGCSPTHYCIFTYLYLHLLWTYSVFRTSSPPAQENSSSARAYPR